MSTGASQPAVRRVIVGIADTPETDPAVRWGADHAARIGADLHLVHAFVWPLHNVDVDPIPGIAGSGLRGATDALIAHCSQVARAAAPGVRVSAEVVDGRAADVLLDVSSQADVLVVGSRGLGRVLALVMGSTSISLARHAHCPVVIVRGDALTDGPVSVAYEASELGRQALRRAGALAALHDARLEVVIAVATPERERDRILETVRREVAASGGGVDVAIAAHSHAADARELIEASEGTRMLVVPARSEEAVSASSQTSALVQLAHTPVWVERPLAD